jgi:hypothetical protein
MIEANSIVSFKTVFYISILFALIYNIMYYKNTTLIFIIIVISVFYFYSMKVQAKHNLEKQLQHSNINKIIENFEIDFENMKYIPSEIYEVFKKPKKFKYLQLNKIFNINLLELQFLEKLDKYAYFEIFVVVEYFLKFYYQALMNINKNDIQAKLENMILLRKKVVILFDEIKIMISRSRKNFILENKVEKIIKKILQSMKTKISVIKKLIEI